MHRFLAHEFVGPFRVSVVDWTVDFDADEDVYPPPEMYEVIVAREGKFLHSEGNSIRIFRCGVRSVALKKFHEVSEMLERDIDCRIF